MKTDITYSYVYNSLIIFVNGEPENEYEKENRKMYEKAVKDVLERKLLGSEDDDGNFLGINFEDNKRKNIEREMKRVVKTICNDLKMEFKLKINFITE
jgi:hypothetical protein